LAIFTDKIERLIFYNIFTR